MEKILYIDMDGVVANFDALMSKLLPNIPMGDGEDYDVRSGMVNKVAFKYPTLFEDLKLVDGAYEAVNKLRRVYDVYFLSTPMSAIPESYMGKRKWVKRNFGEWADKRLILTHRKDLCIGDILIDDRTRNGAGEFRGELIQFGTEKFKNWQLVLEYLLK